MPAPCVFPRSARTGGRGPCHLVAAALVTAALGVPAVAASAARANEVSSPTPQAQLARAGFLTRVGAVGDPSVVCMVDTGVDLNDDTRSLLVGRESLYAGNPSGGDTGPHGSYMAAAAAAPVNGYGSVGAWPAGRVLSVAAEAPGEAGFRRDAWQNGINRCMTAKLDGGVDVRVINLSLGGQRGDPQSTADLQNTIDYARFYGVVVVAAAGNTHGGAVEYPAGLDGVIAVGAAQRDGSRCGLSAAGSRIDVYALGCDGFAIAEKDTGRLGTLDGTSGSAAFVSGVIAALTDRRPDLTPAQVSDLIRANAPTQGAGPVLDATRLFSDVGLGELTRPADHDSGNGDDEDGGNDGGGDHASAPVAPVAPVPAAGPGLAAPAGTTVPTTVASRRRASRLRVRSAVLSWTNRSVLARGALTRYATGKVTVYARYTLRGQWRTRHKRTRVHTGRFSKRITLPRGASRVRVYARYAGNAKVRAGRANQRVAHHARRASSSGPEYTHKSSSRRRGPER